MRFTVRLLSLLFALAVVSTTAANEQDVDYWIDRMGESLRTENYSGTFTYMRGQQFDTIEVFHSFENGEETERLVLMNGEHREIIRHGDEIVCLHEHAEDVELNHQVPLGPFTHAFNQRLSNFQSLYEATLLGQDRIAGREAVKLAITPRQSDRWGYRLWLDKESGLLLQSHLVGRGKVLEVFQFTNVRIGEQIDAENLETTLIGDVAQHELAPIRPREVAQAAAARPEWRVSWLPTGFHQVASPKPNRIVFTDGVATFTVFIERSVSRGEFGALMGGTAVITRQLKDSSQQITVVGEVPIDTAKKVAESIEPVIY